MIDRRSEHVSDVRGWSEALDEIEQHLDRSERFLEVDSGLGAEDIDADQYRWSAPIGLGPIPAPLERRALTLLDRLAQTERAVSDQALLASRRMASVNRPDPRRKAASGTRFDSVC